MAPLSKDHNMSQETEEINVECRSHYVRHRSVIDGKSTYFQQYVSFEGSKNILNYQYKGSDRSLIYKHILNPMNNYLVELLPLWLAPNLITLIGFSLVCLSHLVFSYYCPSFEGDAPVWAFLVAAFCLLSYQTLDNLDGKQARRTGSSSPLGLLFDHGCDALNVTVGCCTMASVLQFGATWKALLFVISGNVSFTFATWEEYYTGALDLPIINGPTEGILIGVFLKLITAFFGVDIWTQELIPGLQNNTAFLLLSSTTCAFTLASNVYNVYRAVRRHNDSLVVAFTRLTPFAILYGLTAIWVAISPSDIMGQHPRLLVWTLGMLNSKLVLHLMLAHLCGEEYHPFRKTLMPIFYVASHAAYSWLNGIYSTVDETLILYEFFYISLVSYLHIAVCVVLELTQVLGINIFTIPYKSGNHEKDN